MPVKKILFVCLGNICRSPLAEAIFKKKIADSGVEHLFEVDSCGTANYHVGHTPDPRTLRNAEKNGVRIQHLGRQLSPADLETFDLILAMDHSNHTHILKLSTAESHAHKVKLMREFDSHEVGAAVPDPYYGADKDFQEVFDILDRSMDVLLANLLKV